MNNIPDYIQVPENWNRIDKDGNPIKYDNFVNLHCHSFFSLLDGMSSPKSIVDRTYELGQPASVISDHGVMFSMVDHFKYAKEKGQHAIAAFEAYVVKDHALKTNDNDNRRQHLLLIAKNAEGYKKLSYWCSVGCTDGFYYKPRIDNEIMARTGGKDIIACTACIGGLIPQLILKDKMDEAIEIAKEYNDFFEEFYLEIQPTMDSQQVKVNMGLLEISKKLNIPLVATSDAHYVLRSDAETHDVLLALQTGKMLDDPTRWRFKGDTFFIASRSDMEQLFDQNGHHVFPKDALKEALDNSVKIANNCTFELELGKNYLPTINIPIDNEEFINWHKKTGRPDLNGDYLKYLCIKGLKARGLSSKEYKERLDYELKVIGDMGFNDYFLIYYDIAEFCIKEHVPMGPGRGCFLPENRVRLANGELKLINEVLFGDIVIGHDEKPHKVINTFEYDCNEEIVDLLVDEFKNIKCTKDHKIYAIKQKDWNNGIRNPEWYEADELEPGDYIAEV